MEGINALAVLHGGDMSSEEDRKALSDKVGDANRRSAESGK